jgi:hypothetical protein
VSKYESLGLNFTYFIIKTTPIQLPIPYPEYTAKTGEFEIPSQSLKTVSIPQTSRNAVENPCSKSNGKASP